MTAGRGIVHSEMPSSEEEAHGLQLWVNLPAADKMMQPCYQECQDIPLVEHDGVRVRVLAGECMGVKVSTEWIIWVSLNCQVKKKSLSPKPVCMAMSNHFYYVALCNLPVLVLIFLLSVISGGIFLVAMSSFLKSHVAHCYFTKYLGETLFSFFCFLYLV